MNFIAFDTSHRFLRVCAEVDGKLSVHEDRSPLQHSTTLMPAIDRLLGENKKCIEAIGVCVGPGSFTGIRIGVTTAKTLAWAWNVPIVPFTSAELYGFREKKAWVAVDGGNRVYYAAAIADGRVTGGITEIGESEMAAAADAQPYDAVLIGYEREERICKEPDLGAAAIAELVRQKLFRGETCGFAEAEPLYIQLSQAEKDKA